MKQTAAGLGLPGRYLQGPPRSMGEREVFEYRVEATLMGGGKATYYVVAATPAGAKDEIGFLYPAVVATNVSFSGRRFVVVPEGDDYQREAPV